MKSRRLTSSIGRPPAWCCRSVYRMLKLPQRGCQVLGADLNCSESRRCRHAMRQQAAALRDFTPVFVRLGSEGDITRLPSNVLFTPPSGESADMLECLLCAISGHSHRSKKARHSRAVRQKEARHAVTARSTPVHYSG